MAPTKTTLVINPETKEEKMHSESLRNKHQSKPIKVAHSCIGETRLAVTPLIQGNTVVKVPAKLIVPSGDNTPVEMADSGASYDLGKLCSTTCRTVKQEKLKLLNIIEKYMRIMLAYHFVL